MTQEEILRSLQSGATTISGGVPGATTIASGSGPTSFKIDPNAGVTAESLLGTGGAAVLGATTSTTPKQAGPTAEEKAAAAAKAAEVALQTKLRNEITAAANKVKDIYNSRYGLVDAVAQEQNAKLDQRFTDESQQLTNQAAEEGQRIGAASAATGTFDSSYRGNNVDTVSNAAANQIKTLGQELETNKGEIGKYVQSEKDAFDAEKSGLDLLISRIAESTDTNELTTIRNQIDAKINDQNAKQSDYNTGSKNRAALEQVAPTSQRAVQLKTTLSKVLQGPADATLKARIGQQLISSAGLSEEEARTLLSGFTTELQKQDQQQ